MNESNHISDKDRQLAREFGRHLAGSQGSIRMDDSLLSSLKSFKESELAGPSESLSSRREENWKHIKQNINRSTKSKETLFYRLGSIKHFGKIAAAITISVILSIYYFQIQSTIPQPLATSGNTIESVSLKDGSTVILRPHSKLFELTTNSGTHAYKLEGEAYFSVSKNENRKFMVQAENGFVEVLGTEFNIRTWDSSTEVYLKTGSLRLSSDDEENSAILTAGEFASLMTNKTISVPRPADEELFTSWRNSEIIFINRRAESIFNELEHHYSIDITAPDDVKNETLGGSLSLISAQQSLNNLGTVLGGEFIQTGNNAYEFVSAE